MSPITRSQPFDFETAQGKVHGISTGMTKTRQRSTKLAFN